MKNQMMKQFSVLAVGILTSASSWACLDLSGSYTCVDPQGKQQDLSVQQQAIAGGVHYTMTSVEPGKSETIEVNADGKEYDIPEGHGIKNGKYTAACNAEVDMTLNVTGILVDDQSGQDIGKLTMTMVHSRGANKELVVVSSGVAETPYGNFPLDNKMTCTLK